MRTMLLSFKPEVFDRVVSGQKIFEHRSVFPNEDVIAYLYVSSPVQAIKGVMLLTNKVNLIDWKEQYKNDIEVIKRIDKYLKDYKCVMQISRFQNTTSISLDRLRKERDRFIVPQMYYYLDGTDLLKYIQDNIEYIGEPIEHDFSCISSEQICVL
ncbi:hypothetical protein [uncultured Eubacterium sp.]|uniref:hypothetical protein n=1 Tax=uncultured Eubacterium sp. TaxID=165185 RepID=UPI0026734EE4|nr:hypothetical protein [uncultured Eubacterium sp.]